MGPIVNRRKTRLIYAGAGALMLAIPTTAVALTTGPLSSPSAAPQPVRFSAPRPVTKPKVRTAAQRGCAKLFTVKMGERAARRIYSGHARVPEHDLRLLGYIEHCLRNPARHGLLTRYDRHQGRMHRARVSAARAAAAAHLQAAQQQQYQSRESAPSQAPASSSSSSSSQQAGGSGWAIPSSVVQCESGGQNQPPNSAGASGYYQIIPSTWQAYGGGSYAPSAYQATPQEQATVASKIWNGGSGASQWTCAGGR
jgi:Transglycosylase-like domain